MRLRRARVSERRLRDSDAEAEYDQTRYVNDYLHSNVRHEMPAACRHADTIGGRAKARCKY